MHIVWFKKDLRTMDHEPLYRARSKNKVIYLYIYEPEWFQSEEFESSKLSFLNECLVELDAKLAKLGARLTLEHGNALDVFRNLHEKHNIRSIASHLESGQHWTFMRDKSLLQWTQNCGIKWREYDQFGVQRRLKDRDRWAQMWKRRMSRPIIDLPESLPHTGVVDQLKILETRDLDLNPDSMTGRQKGGEDQAHQVLESFLDSRGENYSKEMSSPVTAWNSCSRLSTYLAFGCISMKFVHQRTKEVQEYYRSSRDATKWKKSLSTFQARLHWHCHFIQKLESQPSIEFENFHRGYDGLREEFNSEFFEAWKHGQTGYPIVDACMRSLKETGWINFRMRAMLVSFASYHLWLHWRRPAQYLAKYFLDYEPGIHFSQFQMQSGTTGINTIRIYSPHKQVTDHDPNGTFIRKFVPELEAIPNEYLADPQSTPPLIQASLDFKMGKDYPKPVVDHKTAYNEAKSKVYAWRKKPGMREMAEKVYQQHGSRRG